MPKKIEIQKFLLLRLEFIVFFALWAPLKNFTRQKIYFWKTKVVVLTWVNNFVKRQKIPTWLLSEIRGGPNLAQKYMFFAFFGH